MNKTFENITSLLVQENSRSTEEIQFYKTKLYVHQ